MKRERIVSRTLMAGIIVSGSFMLAGFLLYAFQPGYHDAPIPAASWTLLQDLLDRPTAGVLNPFIYLYAGILLLMATPIVRILITAWTFWKEGDMRYVWISLVVLTVIGISIGFSVVH